MTKTIAFMCNQLSMRGTETSLWLFAHHNEITLGNKSIIIVMHNRNDPYREDLLHDNNDTACRWFVDRFEKVYFNSNRNEVVKYMIEQQVDACFYEIAGVPEEWIPSHIPSIAHCVFQPYARCTVAVAIHNSVAMGLIPVLPNPLYAGSTSETMRTELEIPEDAVVFGRYGGFNQFDIDFARDAVEQVAQNNSNIYFVFMNTAKFVDPDKYKNIRFLEGTRDFETKRRFINTCDAMLHARQDGETFGMSIGEFAICNKNVITYRPWFPISIYAESHIDILEGQCITYRDKSHLIHILEKFSMYKKDMTNNKYYEYSCEKVVTMFAKCLEEAFRRFTLTRG